VKKEIDKSIQTVTDYLAVSPICQDWERRRPPGGWNTVPDFYPNAHCVVAAPPPEDEIATSLSGNTDAQSASPCREQGDASRSPTVVELCAASFLTRSQSRGDTDLPPTGVRGCAASPARLCHLRADASSLPPGPLSRAAALDRPPPDDITSRKADLDWDLVDKLSDLVEASSMSLPDLVTLWRGETTRDPRPNKALRPDLWGVIKDFPDVGKLEEVAMNGYVPHFKETPPKQSKLVKNHGGVSKRLPVLLDNIAADQRTGKSLVLWQKSTSHWDYLRSSKLAVVPKGDKDPALVGRTINDLKAPPGINGYTDQEADLRKVGYQKIGHLAGEVLRARRRDKGSVMMAGDVAGAFRHIPVHRDYCNFFVSSIPSPSIVVVDLYCCFGWTESPRAYDLAGGAINFLHSLAGFFAHYWVDDHVSVESGGRERQRRNQESLRAAMLLILGPNAINEDKFTKWKGALKVLGLEFDLPRGTVSMPTASIEKAKLRALEILKRLTANRQDMLRLMGSLRHVGTCVRPVAGFLQKLSVFLRMTSLKRIALTEGAQDDLQWILRLLHKPNLLQGICLEYFCMDGPPDVEVNMDASDHGLCAVAVSRREFIRMDFDAGERELILTHKTSPGENQLSINVRELWTASLAAICWGKVWGSRRRRPTRVEFVIDNSSAVSWANSLASRNVRAQPMLRAICATELKFNIRFTARHIAGTANDLTDAGSRFHDQERRDRFTKLTRGYEQVEIPDGMREPSSAWSSLSESVL
jgi:hypothetical protein